MCDHLVPRLSSLTSGHTCEWWSRLIEHGAPPGFAAASRPGTQQRTTPPPLPLALRCLILRTQSGIESAPAGVPTYLTAAVGPGTLHAPRKFCTVCGFESP